jgi:hypothetical protein
LTLRAACLRAIARVETENHTKEAMVEGGGILGSFGPDRWYRTHLEKAVNVGKLVKLEAMGGSKVVPSHQNFRDPVDGEIGVKRLQP